MYVDDILLMSSNDKLVTKVKEYLHSLFTIKDLGLAKYFLGIEVMQEPNKGIFISQIKYIVDLLKDAGLSSYQATTIPFDGGK